MIEDHVLYVIDQKARALELPAKAEKGMHLRELWEARLVGKFMASPVYKDGLIYTIENQMCRLNVIDAKTGEILTSTRSVGEAAKSGKVERGVKIEGLAPAKYAYASPVVAEKSVFFFDDAGNTALLELGHEYRPLRVNKLADGVVGSPFFFKDKIIIRGTNTVYCVAEKR
jgi:hypothetical protein